MMQRLGQAHKAVSGKDPVYSPVTCTTDVRFFELYYGIPATCYGPEATNIHGYLLPTPQPEDRPSATSAHLRCMPLPSTTASMSR
jgi:hypothetical protein